MIPKQAANQDEILAFFGLISKQNTSLLMTKSFRGIIINQEVKPDSVDRNHVVFQAYNRDICPALEGCVHLHSPLLSKPVKALVKDLSISRGMFLLSDFSYLESEWKEREHERVQPEAPTYVTLYCQSMEYRASMLDLSVNGMGLLVGNSEKCEMEFEANSCVRTDFEPSPGFRWLKLGGAIHYQVKVAKSIVRLGIRLYPKIEQARQLEKYVAKRKAEIMQELEQAYLNASLPLGVECQYF
jgi:hypothetical protein